MSPSSGTVAGPKESNESNEVLALSDRQIGDCRWGCVRFADRPRVFLSQAEAAGGFWSGAAFVPARHALHIPHLGNLVSGRRTAFSDPARPTASLPHLPPAFDHARQLRLLGPSGHLWPSAYGTDLPVWARHAEH